jgi:hypothetical protein
MRVVDRCLDTASTGETGADLTAAAARASTDPALHQAISGLLTIDFGACQWNSWRHAMSIATQEFPHCEADDCESADLHIFTVSDSDCAAAGECEQALPLTDLFTRCAIASRELARPGNQTARVLFQLILTAVALERSSLGDRRARRLRGTVPTSDIMWALRRSERP